MQWQYLAPHSPIKCIPSPRNQRAVPSIQRKHNACQKMVIQLRHQRLIHSLHQSYHQHLQIQRSQLIVHSLIIWHQRSHIQSLIILCHHRSKNDLHCHYYILSSEPSRCMTPTASSRNIICATTHHKDYQFARQVYLTFAGWSTALASASGFGTRNGTGPWTLNGIMTGLFSACKGLISHTRYRLM